MPNFVWVIVIAVVAILAWVVLGPGSAHGAQRPHLKVDFAYAGKSPQYATTIDGIQLLCREYWGPGHVYVSCVLAPAKKVSKTGPAA